MAFSEPLKLSVRRQSAFRCCLCHNIGVEIHHIVPQAEGGPDTLSNAAALCPSCHTIYGGNPEKRKQIRQMRDWWYEVVEQKGYIPTGKDVEINDFLTQIAQNEQQGIKADLNAILRKLDNLLQTRLKQVESDPSSPTRLVNEYVDTVRLAQNVHTNFHCKRCNTYVGLMVGGNTCPNCGAPIG